MFNLDPFNPSLDGVGRRLLALNIKLMKLILQTGCPSYHLTSYWEISPNLETLSINTQRLSSASNN